MRKEEKIWDEFVIRRSGSFLQSFGWGEFQESFGRKTRRLKGDKNKWRMQIFEHSLPFGLSYFYVPRGPIINVQKQDKSLEFLRDALEEVKKLAGKEKAVFIKIEPESFDVELLDVLEKQGFLSSSKTIQPARTILLDIGISEKELQLNFKPKARYNIRLAIRRKVRVRKTETADDFEKFWRLLDATSERQDFRIHPKIYYQKMFSCGVAELFLAEYTPADDSEENFSKPPKAIAGALVNFFGERATYLHGASSYEHRSLMAPHFLHWRIIREAKSKGCRVYDFWGVDEKRWPGVTRFKQSWGGFQAETPGAWDFVIKPFWYRVYKMFAGDQ
jgi:lipid II:glycine glycyltransferase (peptidoglycan interpeptide bridge formation enzyme)